MNQTDKIQKKRQREQYIVAEIMEVKKNYARNVNLCLIMLLQEVKNARLWNIKHFVLTAGCIVISRNYGKKSGL